MRHLDESPLDPDIAASLEAIDATLIGDPVDPRHAELAELALLLAAGRPEMPTGFANSLDERVNARFARPKDSAGRLRSSFARGSRRSSARWRGWVFAPGALAALTVAGVLVVVLSGGGSATRPGSGAFKAASTAASTTAASAASAPPAEHQLIVPLASGGSAPGVGARKPLALSPVAPSSAGPSGPAGLAGSPASLQPPANGRKVVQSAQLNLSAPANRIDDVAQQVFNVIGAQNGIVQHSTVTATGGPDGYAEFQLSVPSSSLSRTMADLSALRYSRVLSRTDSTQDVNNQFVSGNRRLADARALRSALLKQLASAVTTEQIDSLTARIHDAEASIASDQASLRSLNGRVSQSQITVTINAGVPPPVAPSHGGSFTVGKAAHDAGRVLTVAAGVALIALAALVPVALIGALAAWIAVLVRRRLREHALDLA